MFSYFDMPVPVRLTLSNGTIINLKLNNSYNGQVFPVTLPSGTTVQSVAFDPNKDIISKNSKITLRNTAKYLENLINVYPNPINNEDYITIASDESLIIKKTIIYNLFGQKVAEGESEKIILNNLNKGVYKISIETNEGVIHKKMIKN